MAAAMRFFLMMVIFFVAFSTPQAAAGDSRSRSVSIRTKPGEFIGVRASLNIWNLSLTADAQYSTSSLKIYQGFGIPGSKLSVIEAGLMVNRKTYSDNEPRLFVRWSTKHGGHDNGCLNFECQGFVQFSRYILVGEVRSNSSVFRGNQESITVLISLLTDGNWWLDVGNEPVGYWPGSLFNNEMKYGNVVEWGGAAVINGDFIDDKATFPPMGSGHFPSEGEFKVAAYMKQLQVLNRDGQYEDAPSGDGVVITNEAPTCYGLKDHGNDDGSSGRHFYFGGPGGKC
ncbi:hypothetical protein H6P81_004406 [Aristolochia fimbriata]|uniref:Neprosin PEP catalytic domain-containing protein n=1 Tax=Aristolochia fimbriata TaxID=158543 RepID=A0AAV7FG08_ARIFI|nr:hypothetical protein H6P81_004406 [Aristolochia fimbriata]